MSLIASYGYGRGEGEGLIASYGYGSGSFISAVLGAVRTIVEVLLNQVVRVEVEL